MGDYYQTPSMGGGRDVEIVELVYEEDAACLWAQVSNDRDKSLNLVHVS